MFEDNTHFGINIDNCHQVVIYVFPKLQFFKDSIIFGSVDLTVTGSESQKK